MKWVRLTTVSFINAITLIVVFILTGNVLNVLTGQYVDEINAVSVVASLLCFGLLAGTSLLESKKLNLPIWAIVASTLLIAAVGSIGLALTVARIAGGIG